ncbi:MAG: secretin N-terminal domain-containing protein [Planctomycetaceae bacterium]
MNLSKSSAAFLVLTLLAAGGFSQIAEAQRGGSGRRSTRSRNGVFDVINDAAVQAELKIDQAILDKVDALREGGTRPDAERLGEIYGRRQAAKSDEERQAIDDEIRKMFAEQRLKMEAELGKLVGDKPLARLRQISLQRQGINAVLQDDIASELKLTDKQRDDLRAVSEKRREAFRGLRGASEEDVTKLREDFESKSRAILTTEQQGQWQAKLGPALASAAPQDKKNTPYEEDAGKKDAEPADAKSNPPKTSTEVTKSDDKSPAPAPATADNAGTKSTTTVRPDQDKSTGEVIVSFGDNKSRPGEPLAMSFNFQYAPWDGVLKLFAKSAGLTLHLRDVPPGTFNYLDDGKYTPTQAIDVLNGYLLQEGYILVHRDKFLVCLGYDEEKFGPVPPNLIPIVTAEDLPKRGQNELLSVVLSTSGVDAKQLAAEVEELLGPQGKARPISSTSSIFVTDIGSNLSRVARLLSNLEGPVTEDLKFKSFPLKFILATEAERHIRSLFGLAGSVKNVSAAAESRSRSSSAASSASRFSRDSRSRDPREQQRSSSSSNMTSKVRVTSDTRMNALLITATDNELMVIEEVIQSIDIMQDPSIANMVNNNVPLLKVYKVTKADPTEVTKSLEAIIPGVVVNEDGRNRLIHIMATPLEHEKVESLIRQLDGGSNQVVDIVRLNRYDAATMAVMLNGLFLKDGADAPTIQAESLTSTLIIRGSNDQIAQVRQTLLSFGEDGTAAPPVERRQTGNLRTIPLSGRDPVRFARMLEAMLSGDEGISNSIRVVIPQDKEADSEQRLPTGLRPQTLERPRNDTPIRDLRSEIQIPRVRNQTPRFDSTGDSDVRFDSVAFFQQPKPRGADTKRSAVESEAASDNVTPENSDTEQPSDRQENASPVTIRVSGGELIIYSADQNALDRVEDMIYSLTDEIPPETRWTVFYLRSADATEASAMLEQLMPDSSVSASTATSDSGLLGGLTSGISSFGSSLASMTGLSNLTAGPMTLRIIPDMRSNSLFVSGPVEDVNNVEKFLQILDAEDLPGTSRDRVPRTIEIQYADVEDVAATIQDLYKDYLEDPRRNQQQRGGGGNPFAAMMGGGGSSQSGGKSPGIRLTMHTDTRTNSLLLSCDEPTYREIEELVFQRDLAAYKARRTVKVVTLDHANSVVIQQALSALIPKVNVSSSGTSSSRSRTSGQPGSSSSADADRQRRIAEFMRMRSGGGSGSPSRSSSSRSSSSRSGSTGTSRFGGSTGGSRRGGR